MDPPTYESSSGNKEEGEDGEIRKELKLSPALLNLVPRPREVSFQQGFLGFTASSIQGALQIKFVDPGSSNDGNGGYRSSIESVVVEFSGVERIIADGEEGSSDEFELARERNVLWSNENTNNHQSASTSEVSSGSGPPGNIDFDFQLTDDLPHCCHIGSGSIKYSLTAILYSNSSPPLAVTIPIHLSRTSAPLATPSTVSSSPLAISPNTLSPEMYTSQHPTEVSVFFPHGTSSFRRSESIELRVRIPPPDVLLVQEKGLKLRSVSAELLRKISVRTSASSKDSEITPLVDIAAASLITIISKSGKSAAFSSQRSVFLNIWLQPVSAESCESITQSTIFQEVSFSVRVMTTVMGRQGDREELLVLNKNVTIIPDYPPVSYLDQNLASKLHVPAAVDSTYKPAASGSGSASRIDPDLLAAFREEEEFDGYEQLSEGASVENAPPSIDADQPPPSLDDHEEGGLQGCPLFNLTNFVSLVCL